MTIFCSKCVLSSNFPNIKFNEEGICNFCSKFKVPKKESIDINNLNELQKLISSNKGKKNYDCICCYSGGKDSTYLLDFLKRNYNLRVLAMTINNGFISDIAIKNINKVVENLNIDHFMVKPKKSFIDKMYSRAMFGDLNKDVVGYRTRISDACLSCISLVNSTAYNLASKLSIPFIFAGFTAGQVPRAIILNPQNFYRESYKKRRDTYILNLGPESDDYFNIADTSIDHFQISPFLITKPTENQIISRIKKIGWEMPTGLDGCSTNCKLNSLGNCVHKIKYGFHPYEAELSQLIRVGAISREEAFEKLKSKGDDKYIKKVENHLRKI